MASKKRPDILNEDLLALREQGLSNKEIAAKVGVTQRTVYDRIGKAGAAVDARRKRKKPNDPVKMQKLRDRGLSNKEIAEKLDISTRTVERGIGSDAQHRQQAESTDMRKLYESGMTKTAIAKQFGVSLSTVNRRLQAPAETTPVEPQNGPSEPLEAEVAQVVENAFGTPPERQRIEVTSIFSFAVTKDWSEKLQALAELAQPEPWQFVYPERACRFPETQILEKYICETFRCRVREYNDNLTENPDKIFYFRDDCCCFHTGLYTPTYESIYALFLRNRFKSPTYNADWSLIGFYPRTSPAMRDRAPLPEHREILSSDVPHFDPSKEIGIDINHILNRRDCTNRLPDIVMEYWNVSLMVETAVELARRQARIEPNTVVTTLHHGKVSYLLPLYMTSPVGPDAVAAIIPNGEGYTCVTVLTLNQAYCQARTNGRPTAEWLTAQLGHGGG